MVQTTNTQVCPNYQNEQMKNLGKKKKKAMHRERERERERIPPCVEKETNFISCYYNFHQI